MRWYVSRSGKTEGPIDEATIVEWSRAGQLPPGTMVRDEAGSPWTPVEQSPFASFVSRPQHASRKELSPIQVISALGALIAFVALYIWVDSCRSKASKSTPVSIDPVPAPAPAPTHHEATTAELLAGTNSLQQAILILKPSMTDVVDQSVQPASIALAGWGHEKLLWADLNAMPDTVRAEAMKDIDGYRGQRNCSQGTVVEIHTDRSTGKPLYWGGLMTASFDVVRFLAVRSTHGITQQSAARFCGVVIGLNSYTNSAGGTAHALEVVGMFDLPENRKP